MEDSLLAPDPPGALHGRPATDNSSHSGEGAASRQIKQEIEDQEDVAAHAENNAANEHAVTCLGGAVLASHAESVVPEAEAAEESIEKALSDAEKEVDKICNNVQSVKASFNFRPPKFSRLLERSFNVVKESADKLYGEAKKMAGEIDECYSTLETDSLFNGFTSLVKNGFEALVKLEDFAKDLMGADANDLKNNLVTANAELRKAVEELNGSRFNFDAEIHGLMVMGQGISQEKKVQKKSIKAEKSTQNASLSHVTVSESSDDEPLVLHVTQATAENSPQLLSTPLATPNTLGRELQPKDPIQNQPNENGSCAQKSTDGNVVEEIREISDNAPEDTPAQSDVDEATQIKQLLYDVVGEVEKREVERAQVGEMEVDGGNGAELNSGIDERAQFDDMDYGDVEQQGYGDVEQQGLLGIVDDEKNSEKAADVGDSGLDAEGSAPVISSVPRELPLLPILPTTVSQVPATPQVSSEVSAPPASGKRNVIPPSEQKAAQPQGNDDINRLRRLATNRETRSSAKMSTPAAPSLKRKAEAPSDRNSKKADKPSTSKQNYNSDLSMEDEPSTPERPRMSPTGDVPMEESPADQTADVHVDGDGTVQSKKAKLQKTINLGSDRMTRSSSKHSAKDGSAPVTSPVPQDLPLLPILPTTVSQVPATPQVSSEVSAPPASGEPIVTPPSEQNGTSSNEERPQKKNNKWDKYYDLSKINTAPSNIKLRQDVSSYSQDYFSSSAIDSVETENEAAHTPEGRRQLEKIASEVKEIGCIREMSTLRALQEPNGYRGLGPAFEASVLSGSTLNSSKVGKKRFKADKPPPQCSFVTPALMNPFTSTGADVVKEVEEAAQKNTVAVFENTNQHLVDKHFESYPKGAVENEQKFYGDFCSSDVNEKCEEQMDAGCYPVPSFTVTSKSQEKEIEEIMKKSSACLFKGIDKVYGLDLSKFKAMKVLKKSKSETVTISQGLAQPTFVNFHYPLGPQSSYSGVRTDTQSFTEENINKEGFMAHYEAVEKLAIEARKQIGEGKDRKEVVRALGEELAKLSLEIEVVDHNNEKERIKPECLLSAFCPSFDLTADDEDLNAEIRKLPLCMHPNGEKDQMRHGGKELPGINWLQSYFKFPGCRTPLHNEDYVLTSFNINVGKGACVWYLIPREYTDKVHDLLRKKKMFSGFVKKQKLIWLHAKDLISEGIKFYKVVQEPGVMMFTGVGTYHLVQSVGFADNVSWNVMMPTFNQLACSAAQHDFNVAYQYRSAVPIHQIIWQMAFTKQEVDGKTKELLKAMLMRSLATAKREELYIKNVVSKQHKCYEFKNLKEMESRGESHNIEPYSMCENCSVVLFNYVPLAKLKIDGKLEYAAYCLKCLKSKNVLQRAKEFTVYEWNTIKELEKGFDSIELHQ